ncbi:MAG TPA: hypothetical protein VFE47_18170 [Tepidisphaeraceae bacterium]|nr:hypothetical protein [Tepidisphaeraceae bacterium]
MSDIPQPIPVLPIQLSYASLAGDQVPAATRENVHLLQHAADYEVCKHNLRRSGIGDMIWGLVCCATGAMLFRYSNLNSLLIMLGLGLVGVGFWITFHPSPIGMVVDGITLLVVAAWNLMVNAMDFIGPRSAQAAGFGPVVAFAQIFWGIHRLQQYRRFATAVGMQPSQATLAWFRELSKATLKAKPKKELNSIEFLRRGWFVYERWKGRLMPENGGFCDEGRVIWRKAGRTVGQPGWDCDSLAEEKNAQPAL